jgi:hypothetical protein
MTDAGQMRIDKVSVGDKVLTEDGSYHEVAKVFSRRYVGKWVQIKVGQKKLVMTSNHPVKVYRGGIDSWVPADEIKSDDMVYVMTKPCSHCHKELVPCDRRVCPACFLESDHSIGKREKLSVFHKKGERSTSRLYHHSVHVLPHMEEFRKNGYRVIPMVQVIPDFIAMKDGKVIAVEVESVGTVRLGKQGKYEKMSEQFYDDVVWITKPTKRIAKSYKYEIVGNLARVPICFIRHYDRRGKSAMVYNLTVKNSPTYFAHGILVHNCHSFQAVKTISTVDGGALVCREKTDHERGRLLRWFGIDRDNPTKQADLRCEAPIHEVGGKYHMNDVSATIGLANLAHYDELIGKTRDNAKFYDKAIAALETSWVQGMYVPDNRVSTYWLYTMRIHKERDRFAELLRKRGVACSKVHSRNDEHPCMPKPVSPLVGVDEWYRTQLSIPCGWWVMPEDREYVMQCMREVIEEMKS